jgi:hypothetical protein
MPHLAASTQLGSRAWPASFHGVGVKVVPLSDGSYQGISDDGFVSVACETSQEALSIVLDWVASHTASVPD